MTDWLTKIHLISFISRFLSCCVPLQLLPFPLSLSLPTQLWSEVSCDKCRNWVASTCHTEGEWGKGGETRGQTVTKLSHCLSEQVKSSAKFWLYCYCCSCGFCCLVSRLIYGQQFKQFYIHICIYHFCRCLCNVNCFACHFVASCCCCCCRPASCTCLLIAQIIDRARSLKKRAYYFLELKAKSAAIYSCKRKVC